MERGKLAYTDTIESTVHFPCLRPKMGRKCSDWFAESTHRLTRRKFVLSGAKGKMTERTRQAGSQDIFWSGGLGRREGVRASGTETRQFMFE